MARSEAEKSAQKRYYQKNKKSYGVNSYRSKAKNFILKYATEDELIWLQDLIKDKIKEIRNER